MTHDLELTELVHSKGIFPPIELLNRIREETDHELGSLGLFDDVLPTLKKPQEQSSQSLYILTWPARMGEQPNYYISGYHLSCMSYAVGFIKPERKIYQWILNRVGVDCSQCLFVGDTFHADFEGPSNLGMRALHLVRNRNAEVNEIGGLLELFPHLG